MSNYWINQTAVFSILLSNPFYRSNYNYRILHSFLLYWKIRSNKEQRIRGDEPFILWSYFYLVGGQGKQNLSSICNRYSLIMRRWHASEKYSAFIWIHILIHPSQHTLHSHVICIFCGHFHYVFHFILERPFLPASIKHQMRLRYILSHVQLQHLKGKRDPAQEKSWTACRSSTIGKCWTQLFQLLSTFFHAYLLNLSGQLYQ